tara:strand:- start:1356 stop:2873 length:1518 start_codon:yes stop_codon:yes gene_type:complete
MKLMSFWISSVGALAASGVLFSTAAQAQGQLTPPSISANGEITGFTPTQGSMVKRKISSSASGSPCGGYLRKRGWNEGLNNAGKPNEFTVALGIAPVSEEISSDGYVDSRYVAFREAWIVANGAMARALESKVSSDASRVLKTRSSQREEISPAEKAASLRKQAAGIETGSENKSVGVEGTISKGFRLLNAAIDKELKALGHDVDAEQKALNEKNAARKKELIAKAEAAEKEAKRITGRRDFKEIIKAVAQERMKGIYSAFTSENLSPNAAAKTQICVALKYSPRSERMADMMAARDFTNAPQLEPDIPLVEQLPDPSNPQGVFQLVTMWGLNILFDENGQVNLVAFGQAGYRNGDENEELAAKETAKLRAEGMIRLFINQTVAVQQAAKVGQTVKSFKDAVSKTALNKETMSRMEQKAGFRPINGLKQVIDWNGIHPVTNGGIAGSVVSWNASEAAGALVSKARQNKRVRDRGGVGINRRNDRSLQSAPTRKGGLRGSTRSRDF